MKNLLLFFTLCLCVLQAIAADYTVGSYVNSYNGKSYSINVRLNNGEIEYVYINMATQTGVTGYFTFKGKDLEKFYSSLRIMSPKFAEWSNTAVENQITTFQKEFEAELPKGSFFWVGTETWMSDRKRLTPMFVVSNGRPMFMFIGAAKALQNQYISETFFAVFININDYDNFTEIFNPDEALKKALKVESLTDKFN